MTRTRTCPHCGHRWPQRRARFCGWCGASLGDAAATPPPRRPSALTVVARALAIVGLAALGVVVMSLDLTRPDPDPTVDLDEDVVEPSPAPLSSDEADSLRAQADEDALRCEPRGCERWRLQVGVDPGVEVVELDDGLVVAPLDIGPQSTEIVALDPATGDDVWRVNLAPDPASITDSTIPMARVQPGPGGVLAYAGATIAAIDPDGDVRWRWSVAELDGAEGELWHHSTFGEVVVVEGVTELSELWTNRLVVGLDADSGEPRWVQVATHSLVSDDGVWVSDEDGVLQALDPITGEPSWRGPQVDRDGGVSTLGPWLLVQRSPDEPRQLVDGDDGRVVETLAEMPRGVPLLLDDGGLLVAVANQYPRDVTGEEPRVAVVRLAEDGILDWRNDLGPIENLWGCCSVRAGPLDTALVSTGYQEWTLHVGHGGTIAVTDTPAGGDAAPTTVQQIGPDLEVVHHRDPRRLELHASDGVVSIRGERPMMLASDDPPIVSDGRHLLGVRAPEGVGDDAAGDTADDDDGDDGDQDDAE